MSNSLFSFIVSLKFIIIQDRFDGSRSVFPKKILVARLTDLDPSILACYRLEI